MRVAAAKLDTAGDGFVPVAAWTAIAGGVLQLALAPVTGVVSTWLSTLDHLMLLVGMVGLARCGALGHGRLASIGPGLSIFGFAATAVAEPTVLISDAVANVLFGVGTLSVMAGLTSCGIATWRANNGLDGNDSRRSPRLFS